MFYRIISTVFFIGYFPFAPGTVATAFVMLILFFFQPSDITLLFLLISSFILGVICADKVEKKADIRDPSYIVIDEFAGALASMFLIPINLQNIILAFLIFRFFDILKPPPIRQIERIAKGGMGIMIDDIIAGIMTNFFLRVILMFK